MRPKCRCGAIAGYWYACKIYKIMDFNSYLKNHAYCASCADTENWAEYIYIGFHKKDWRWLNRKSTEDYLLKVNSDLSKPYYDASHVDDEGGRWHYSRYRSYEKAVEETRHLNNVIIKKGYYEEDSSVAYS